MKWFLLLCWFLFISSGVFAAPLDIDLDNNQAVDIGFGGTNATTATNAAVNLMGSITFTPSSGTWDLSSVDLSLAPLGNGSTSAGFQRFLEDSDNGANYVDLYAPASITNNYSLTLPQDDGGILQTEDTTATLTNKTISAADNVVTIYPPRDWVVSDPADADDYLLFKARFAITITDIHCIVDPADSSESISLDIQECDSTGDNCATVDAAITCDNDGAEDDGALSNGSIDAGDWVKMVLGAPTGAVSALTFSIYSSEVQ
jgi:hypothetical protein